MTKTVLRGKGQLTLPRQVRHELGLADGDDLLITVVGGRIVLTPATLIPREQAWFWTDEWQTGEREVDAELAAGTVTRFATGEDFLADLDAHIAEMDRDDAARPGGAV